MVGVYLPGDGFDLESGRRRRDDDPMPHLTVRAEDLPHLGSEFGSGLVPKETVPHGEEFLIGLPCERRLGGLEYLCIVLFGFDAAQTDEREVGNLTEPEFHTAYAGTENGCRGEPVDEGAVVVEEGTDVFAARRRADLRQTVAQRTHTDVTPVCWASISAIRANRSRMSSTSSSHCRRASTTSTPSAGSMSPRLSASLYAAS